jgi:FixJ family two-component response regulator
MSKRSLVSVVEDDQFFRESMKRLMRSLRYRVEVFASAADFLASPHLGETACLIADLNMPGMTGAELHRHLRDSGHEIPTILVTADADDDVGSRARQDGVICYLRKPVDEKHLQRCILAALTHRERPDD